MDQVECVVIGAGVIGLAVARALALTGREVMVLEQAGAIGTGTSSRNSEVIHAGIYYQQDSLKAQLCVRGKQMLYAYCAERGVEFSRCGKLIVATSAEQVGQLHHIAAKARANGVQDVQWLTAAQAQLLEPQLQCHAALLSPSTGIVDSHGLMLALQGDLENASGMVALHSGFARAYALPSGQWCVQAQDGSELCTRWLINAAGLYAPAVARCIEGVPAAPLPQAYFAKGCYFTLAGKAPFSHLIYPVPETAGLGVHLTLDLGGQAKFGPDVQWVNNPDDLLVDPARGDAFYTEVRKYWPGLRNGALAPGYAGIRPKITPPGAAAADFLIQGPQAHGLPGVVHLLGMESPGLTSSLAIAEYVQQLLLAEKVR